MTTLTRPARRQVFNEMLTTLKEIAELRRKWESDDDTETIDSMDYMDSLQALALNELIAKAEGRAS